MREIEIKLKAPNLDEIVKKLEKLGCHLSDPISQHDTIYSKNGANKEYVSSKQGDIIMRIRRMTTKAEFNLKQQKSGEMDNLEYETEVKDPDVMHQILVLLGYVPTIEVKKVRRQVKFGQYEICLDEVEQLGTFVELEKMAEDDADPEVVRRELFAALAPLDLLPKDEETRGYDTQIYQLKR